MASKDELKKGTHSTSNVMNTVASGNSLNSNDVLNSDDVTIKRGGRKPRPGEYYRFSLNMPIEYKDYLQAAAYKASDEKHVVTITEYICELIRKDMEKNEGK